MKFCLGIVEIIAKHKYNPAGPVVVVEDDRDLILRYVLTFQ